MEIWKWFGLRRISTFLWLVGKERLFNSQKGTLKLSKNDSCLRCGNASESVLHILRDCEDVSNLWMS